jgi:hypothetical protein
MIALSHPLWPFDSETGPCVKVSTEPCQFLAPSYLFSTLQCQSPESLCAWGFDHGLLAAVAPRSFLYSHCFHHA